MYSVIVGCNLGQDGVRGAARRAHSALMRQIAASMGSGGITGTIMRSLSAWHCFAAASSWCCLSLHPARLMLLMLWHPANRRPCFFHQPTPSQAMPSPPILRLAPL
jgi:hypothetical protein